MNLERPISIEALEELWAAVDERVAEELGDILPVTQSTPGLMSASDKTKLDGMPESLAGEGLSVEDGKLSLDLTSDTPGPIQSLQAQGWAEQDGTPTPENPVEIKVARGRNLLDESKFTNQGIDADGTVTNYNTRILTDFIDVVPSESYTCSFPSGIAFAFFARYDPDGTFIDRVIYDTGATRTFIPNCQKIRLVFRKVNASEALTPSDVATAQLERGSTATPYVPYGCVGLEVRNATTQALIDIRAIPLPLKSDGERWAGGLPDGTADALSIDSAGKWEWECPTDEVVLDGSSDETWWLSGNSKRVNYIGLSDVVRRYNGNSIAPLLSSHFVRATSNQNYDGTISMSIGGEGYIGMCRTGEATTVEAEKTWLQSNPVTVLYPLANPTTESGYIDLPSVPDGAVVTCPELAEVGVQFFVKGAREVLENAEAWGRRALAAEARIEALEAAVAALATQ